MGAGWHREQMDSGAIDGPQTIWSCHLLVVILFQPMQLCSLLHDYCSFDRGTVFSALAKHLQRTPNVCHAFIEWLLCARWYEPNRAVEFRGKKHGLWTKPAWVLSSVLALPLTLHVLCAKTSGLIGCRKRMMVSVYRVMVGINGMLQVQPDAL